MSSDGSLSEDADAEVGTQGEVRFEVKLTDKEEDDEKLLRKTYDEGCQCKSKNCMDQFTYDVFRYAVFSCRELNHEQLDMCVLGVIQSQAEECDKVRYSFRGMSVCKSTFCKLHSMSEKRMKYWFDTKDTWFGK